MGFTRSLKLIAKGCREMGGLLPFPLLIPPVADEDSIVFVAEGFTPQAAL